MSSTEARRAIEGILISDEPQAIALTGNWGCGKTYFWNTVIKEAAKKGQFTKYAYISLFGLSNLTELKGALFEQSVTSEQLIQGPTADSFKANLEELEEKIPETAEHSFLQRKVQALKAFGSKVKENASQALPLASNWAGIARTIAFLTVRNYVICIDDLERKGTGLSVKDVLGLVSLLKEQRACKVIVILNSDQLELEKVDFSGYREKVFDREITFAPTVTECAAIAFPDAWDYAKTTTEYAVALNVTNVRILQRVRRTITELQPYFTPYAASLMDEFIKLAVLMTWSYNGSLAGAPAFDFIMDYSQGTRSETLTIEQQGWVATLSAYGFQSMDGIGHQISLYLKNGYASGKELLETLKDLDDLDQARKKRTAFEAAWSLFHDSLTDNQAELVTALRDAFVAAPRLISVSDADNTIGLLRELGEDTLATELSNLWVSQNITNDATSVIRTVPRFFARGGDPEFANAVASARAGSEPEHTLHETILRIAGDRSWDAIDEGLLAAVSEEELANFFIGLGHDVRLASFIEVGTRFSNVVNASPPQKLIYNNFINALRKVAGISKLNELRLAPYLPPIHTPAAIETPLVSND